tara:strand:+ start:883 stop:1050 length:168 start_codon:yes stop_codon:yes gene_type:complete
MLAQHAKEGIGEKSDKFFGNRITAFPKKGGPPATMIGVKSLAGQTDRFTGTLPRL